MNNFLRLTEGTHVISKFLPINDRLYLVNDQVYNDNKIVNIPYGFRRYIDFWEYGLHTRSKRTYIFNVVINGENYLISVGRTIYEYIKNELPNDFNVNDNLGLQIDVSIVRGFRYYKCNLIEISEPIDYVDRNLNQDRNLNHVIKIDPKK
jgi:hypothetical protein